MARGQFNFPHTRYRNLTKRDQDTGTGVGSPDSGRWDKCSNTKTYIGKRAPTAATRLKSVSGIKTHGGGLSLRKREPARIQKGTR
jgi:hypothetical protein